MNKRLNKARKKFIKHKLLQVSDTSKYLQIRFSVGRFAYDFKTFPSPHQIRISVGRFAYDFNTFPR